MNHSEAIHFESVGPFTVEIVPDEGCENPIEEDCFWEGAALCLDFGRYGELKTPALKDTTPQQLLDMVRHGDGGSNDYKGWHIFPVYAYIHSGITINLGGFSCPWDSGQCGFIAVNPKEYPDEGGAYKYAQSMIETADDYLTGNVYGWVVKDTAGEVVESAWGYFGDYDKSGCLDEGKNCASGLIANAEHHTEAHAVD